MFSFCLLIASPPGPEFHSRAAPLVALLNPNWLCHQRHLHRSAALATTAAFQKHLRRGGDDRKGRRSENNSMAHDSVTKEACSFPLNVLVMCVSGEFITQQPLLQYRHQSFPPFLRLIKPCRNNQQVKRSQILLNNVCRISASYLNSYSSYSE